MSLQHRIITLRESLREYKPDQTVDWRVGAAGNALLEQAKQQAPNDPVLAAIGPFERSSGGKVIDRMRAADVAAVLSQVAAAVPDDEPVGAAVPWQ